MIIKQYYYSRDFRKKVKQYPASDKRRIIERINLFLQNPFDPRLQTHKLKGKLQNNWSFSLGYHDRIMFRFRGKDEAEFIDIGTHGIYR